MSGIKIRLKCGECEVEYETSNFKESIDPTYVKDGYCYSNNDKLIKTVEALTQSLVEIRRDYND